MSTTTEHEYLTIAEAAELVRVSPSTIRRWIASGKLHPIRPGERTVRIARAELTHNGDTRRDREAGSNKVSDSRRWREPIPLEERKRRLAVIERLELLRQEQREKYGIADKEGWEILHELREERTRQLMGDE